MNLLICVKIKKMLQEIYIYNKIKHTRYLFIDYNLESNIIYSLNLWIINMVVYFHTKYHNLWENQNHQSNHLFL